MKGYLFIENSNKPSDEQARSREPVKMDNASIPCLKNAIELGYEVYYGTNRNNPEGLKCELPVHLYDSHTYRSITAIKDNYIAIKNALKVVKTGNIDVIHCNTPIGGMVGRLVGKVCHVNKVIYTAHGFHFYKGAPLFNRTILKWAEQIMAHWTDTIITMNDEDYQAAKRFKLKKGGKVYKVHGVGITLDDFKNIKVDRSEKRKEFGLKDTDIVCISAGDLVARKNYSAAIEALAKVENENLHYLICGVGPERENLEKLAEDKGVASRVHFLGFRTDVKELMKISDIFLFTTLQEGLPRSMMEAMACGLPCVASKIRGNVDLIENGVNGILCKPTSIEEISSALDSLACDNSIREKMGRENLSRIIPYDVQQVYEEIKKIYHSVLVE